LAIGSDFWVDKIRAAKTSHRDVALQAIFAHLAAPQTASDPLSGIRSSTENYSMGQRGRGVELCQEVEISIGDRPAVWLAPPGAREDLRLIHLHGGGWVAGSIASHHALAAELAWRANAPVLLPSYRLAPEHPYPAALEDALSVLQHAQAYSPTGLPSSASVCVSGDSAGGNLAAALALKCAAMGSRGPDRIALMSPFLALTLGEGAFSAAVHDPVVQQDGIDFVAAMYTNGATEVAPFIEPLMANNHLLQHLGPMLIQVSGAESLRNQAVAFANRLWEVGVEARLSMWPHLPHVWHVFLGTLPDSRAAVAEAAAFLSES
jgi:monoterpene epsilon-lactone hydrolase